MTLSKVLTIILITGIFSGCSYVTTLRTREINKVEDEVKSLRLQMDSLRLGLVELQTGQEKSLKRLQADLRLLIRQSGEDTDRIAARLEENQYALDNLGSSPASVVSTPVSATPVTAAVSSADAAIQVELEQLYSTARADFAKEAYREAYTGFKSVYEKKRGGKLAQNSLYWMGVCLQESGQAEKSSRAFEELLKEFPDGAKSCPTLARLARIEKEAARKEAHVAWLKLLVGAKQCLGTNESLRAVEELKEFEKKETIKPKAPDE